MLDLRSRGLVGDDQAHDLASTKVVNVPLGREAGVSDVGEQQRRGVHVDPGADTTKLEQRDAARVGEDLGNKLLGRGGLGNGHAEDGDRLGDVVVGTRLGVGHVPGLAGGRGVAVLVVVDDGEGVGLASLRAGGQGAAHPETGARGLVGLDEDVGALTDTEGDDLGLVGADGDVVVGDDGHHVLVDGEALDAVRSRVHEAQAVDLAGLELELGVTGVGRAASLVTLGHGGAVEDTLAVDQVVVRGHLEVATLCRRLEHLLNNVLVVLVVPIAQHDGANVNVVKLSARTIEDHWANDTARVLC